MYAQRNVRCNIDASTHALTCTNAKGVRILPIKKVTGMTGYILGLHLGTHRPGPNRAQLLVVI